MKIENKYLKLQVLEGDIIVTSKIKNKKYLFFIEKMEDIEKLKEFLKKYDKSLYINFYHNIENDKIKIEYENTSKIINSIIIDVLD